VSLARQVGKIICRGKSPSKEMLAGGKKRIVVLSATDRRKGAVPTLFSERQAVSENSVKKPVLDTIAPCAPRQIAQETYRRRLPAEA
jgi:hypothetical protein